MSATVDTKPRRPYRRADKRHFAGVSIRTDAALELRLDALALALSTPEERLSRARAARIALEAGLEALEASRG